MSISPLVVMAFGRVLSALRDFIVVIGFITILSATHQQVKNTSNRWCYIVFSNEEFGCFSQILPFDIPVRMLTQRWSRVRSKAFYGRRKVYYSNSTATAQFELLKLSGNIELNPGPS